MNYQYPNTLFAVIVVYNKSIKNSNTLNCLIGIRLPRLKIIVVDNSTLLFDNNKVCERDGIYYISMCGNKGLSKAYNAALDYIGEHSSKNDLIIWFDDDTEVTQEYFVALDDALLKNNDSEVFAPIIYGQDGKIYSPSNARLLKNKLLKSIHDKVDFDKFFAINSCLAVRQHVYQNYRYDEKLFLDSVDHKFFEDLIEMKIKFTILYTPIIQNFFQRGKDISVGQIKNRLKIRVIDLMAYSQKSLKHSFFGVIKAVGWGIVFSWKCNSISLLVICLKEAVYGFLNNIKFFIVLPKKV